MIGFEFSAAIIALLLVPIFYKHCTREDRLSKVPLIGIDGIGASAHYVSGAKGVIAQGYEKVSKILHHASRIPILIHNKLRKGLSLFKLWTPNGYMCVPSQSHLAELKDLGDDKIDEAAPTDQVSRPGLHMTLKNH